MNLKEYIKYADEMCKNITEKLGEETEEFDFFLVLASSFNYVCNETRNLEQALDDIEKICNGIPIENSICDIGKIHDIEVIIQKAKGDVKNENNNV